jgi:hypothetical protein
VRRAAGGRPTVGAKQVVAQHGCVSTGSGAANRGKRGDKFDLKTYKDPTHHNDEVQLHSHNQASPLTHPPNLSIANMQRQIRTTRTTNNPGLIDLPRPRRSPAEVAAEKQKKQKTAAAKASKKQEREAQVARVEQQIKIAQKEGQRSLGRVGSNGQVKKTFLRETSTSNDDTAKEVSSFDHFSKPPQPTSPSQGCTPQAHHGH